MADFDTLGRLLYEWARNYQTIWEMEVSEEIMPLLQKAGFVELVPYDPALHGAIDEADPGDPIWHWLEPAGCNYPDCVDDSLEGKCVRWLTGECSGPTRSRSPKPPTLTPADTALQAGSSSTPAPVLERPKPSIDPT